MNGWPARPVIYEINTAVWLDELSRQAGRDVTLAEVTDTDWAAVTPDGVEAVWLMGVWERSPAGLALARANAELMSSFRDALPDLKPEDVMGSPYCVRRYVVDAAFGGPEGLRTARAALAARGVRLVLDYVPNHVAPDHPWLQDRPDVFVQGQSADLDADPTGWLQVGDRIMAHGRDPYFPPWPDVVQLNAFAAAMRTATVETLISIADQCDGIRCDMAMLMINEIFARTWGERAGPRPSEEFWPTVIGQLRVAHPETVLIAEAYWDLEWQLQQHGFDFCYDKRLYDRILEQDAGAVRGHLGADSDYQARLLRFLENHDEPRIASKLPLDAERTAAVMLATLPGATLWHEGQFEGRRVRPPVFLSRRPDEPIDTELAEWYLRLLAAVADHDVRSGEWRLLEVTGWPDNQSCANLLAWAWRGEPAPHVVVVNLSGAPAQGRVRLDALALERRGYQLTDLLHDLRYDRDGAELIDQGLYVDVEPCGYYLLKVS
jgi:hypothetical protein